MYINIIANLYLGSSIGFIIIFYFWIKYINKLHMRENMRILGYTIRKKYCKTELENNIYSNMFKHCFKELNSLLEILAGFTDGLLNKECIKNIKQIQNNDAQANIINAEITTQTYQNNIENNTQTSCTVFLSDFMQTDILEKHDIGIQTIDEQFCVINSVEKVEDKVIEKTEEKISNDDNRIILIKKYKK